MSVLLSRERVEGVWVWLENLFITEYMPLAPDSYIKVYLYGLSIASSGGVSDVVSELSRKLGHDTNLVVEAFRYWETQGLVNVVEGTPMTIEYLAVKSPERTLRKFKKEKYKTFNSQLHAMLPSRNILPNEYHEYYTLIEGYHIEMEALLTVIAYCVRLKGESITYPYIVAVAKNLAQEGYTTYDRVSEHLAELELMSGEIGAILKALKTKKAPDHDDRRLFIKWTKTLGFGTDTIINVAKTVKKGGMERLDSLLTRYYESKLMDIPAIEEYNTKRANMFALAKEINRIMGLYYEQLDYIVETYIIKWLAYGFDETTLKTTAEYCFRQNVRTIEGMNDIVKRFYKEGLLSIDSINSFLCETLEIDAIIRGIMEKAGLSRKVTSWDRDYYRTWTYSWGMSQEVIEQAATLSQGKANPLAYMNAVLSGWNETGIKTAQAAQALLAQQPSATTHPDQQKGAKRGEITSLTRSYTDEEIHALFDRLRPEDI